MYTVIHISFLSFNLTEIKVFDILIYFIKFKKNEQNLLNFRYLLYLHRDTNNYYFDWKKIEKLKKYLFKKSTLFHSTKDKRFPFAISIRTFDPLVRFAKLLRCARVCF